MDKNKKYLITGATGFLGKALIKKLNADGYRNIVALARDEGGLIALLDEFNNIKIVAGDVADTHTCRLACKGVSGIFHLAGFKHVRMAEEQTYRCVQTNVQGTINLLECSVEGRPEFFVFTSTDKAARISGVYGATKYLCERLIVEYSKLNTDTQYKILRYGNVWGSTGSIGIRWVNLMSEGKEVAITDPEATRFYFTIDDAINLVLDSIHINEILHISVSMKSVKLGTIFEAFQDIYGKCPVKIIGLQPGENMHETIDNRIFSNEVEQYTKDEFKEKFLCLSR